MLYNEHWIIFPLNGYPKFQTKCYEMLQFECKVSYNALLYLQTSQLFTSIQMMFQSQTVQTSWQRYEKQE
jgi:hypothetical protein